MGNGQHIKDEWRAVYERFDPWIPADRDQRVDRPYNRADTILTGLNRPYGDRRYLLYGTPGTGKTTEFLRIASAQDERYVVVYLDIATHLASVVGDAAAIESLQPWEIVFLVGLAVVRVGQTQLSHSFDPKHIARLASAFKTLDQANPAPASAPSVDVAALAGQIAVFAADAATGGAASALRLAGSALGAGAWSLPLGWRRTTVPDQEASVQELLQSVESLIAELRDRYRPVLVLVDGLDRAAEVDAATRWFVSSHLLASLSCPTVASGPLSLRRNDLAPQVRFTPVVLANVPVMAQSAPDTHNPLGIEFFAKLTRRRMEGLSVTLTPECTAELAYYSGGHVREFMRLVRHLVDHVYDAAAPEATLAHARLAVEDRRPTLESGLDEKDVALLEGVAKSERHLLPGDERVGRLLQRYALLPYPNESEWYFPHPMLTKSLLRLRPAAGSTT